MKSSRNYQEFIKILHPGTAFQMLRFMAIYVSIGYLCVCMPPQALRGFLVGIQSTLSAGQKDSSITVCELGGLTNDRLEQLRNVRGAVFRLHEGLSFDQPGALGRAFADEWGQGLQGEDGSAPS